MINEILDLKNRTFAESNILRSLILQSDSINSNLWIEDVILHDYQIANSITLNSILSNFIVGIGDSYYNDVSELNSYFNIVTSWNEVEFLPDQTKMFLYASDGNGSFYSRDIQLKKTELGNVPGTIQFVMFDSIWYSMTYEQIIYNSENKNGVDKGVHQIDENGELVEEYQYEEQSNGESLEGIVQYNKLLVSTEMTDKATVRREFGVDEIQPFQDIQVEVGDEVYDSLNGFIRNTAIEKSGRETINSINVNSFYHNGSDYGVLNSSKYILCSTSGIYGLEFQYTDGVPSKIVMHDLTTMMPILNGGIYEFVDCKFVEVDGSSTMVVVCVDSDGKYHHLYMNEETYDEVYGGFVEIDELVSNGFVVPVSSVFNKTEGIKTIGNHNIAMTEYGFWDLERNNTTSVTYSYRGIKEHLDNFELGNDRTDKLASPELSVGKDDRLIEYDRVWKLSGDKYVNGTTSYPSQILESAYVGSGDEFAIYWGDDSKCRMLVPFKKVNDFKRMLFSNSTLIDVFLDYVYEQVTNAEKGQSYLKNNYSNFISSINESITGVGFDNLSFQLPTESYPANLNSILELIGASDSDEFKLNRYCTEIYNRLGKIDFIDLEELKGMIGSDFIGNRFEDGGYLQSIVNEVVEKLIRDFPMLSYFKNTLTSSIGSWLLGATVKEVNVATFNQVVESINAHIRGLVQASIVLGGYKNSGDEDNSRYPGIESYLTFNDVVDVKMKDIVGLFGQGVIVDQVSDIVRTSRFFSDQFNDYDYASQHVNDSDLFAINDENGFVFSSGLVSNGSLRVDWGDVKEWMFSPDRQTQQDILKAFIRTKFYRPIFFKADGFDSHFSSDQSKYRCEVDRFYENHEHELTQLKIYSNGVIDEVESNLDDDHIVNVKFDRTKNELSYDIKSDEIQIEDGKFTYGDVQHYVVYNGEVAESIYFNKHVDIDSSIDDLVRVGEGGRFTINGVDYELVQDGGKTILKIDRYPELDEDKFRQELVNDKFEIDGVSYVLERDESGYKFVRLSNGVDHELISVEVKDDNAIYGNLEFKIETGHVVVVNHYRTKVIDRLKEEWCSYDAENISIDANNTFEFYLANHISDMYKYESIKQKIISVEGSLFQGSLDSECQVRIINSVQSGYALTIADFTVPTLDGTSSNTYDLGVLIGGQSDVFDENKVKLDSENAIILKNSSQSATNLNSIKIPIETWNSHTQKVDLTSYTTIDVSYGEISISNIDEGLDVRLSSRITESNIEYQVFQNGEYINVVNQLPSGQVHFVVNQNRYIYDTKSNELGVIRATQIDGTTLDFHTTYNYQYLINQLFLNIRNYMFNHTIIALTTNQNNGGSIIISPSNLNNYNEMFSEKESMDEYSLMSGKVQGDQEYEKYNEVFKTIVEDFGDIDITSGLIHGNVMKGVSDAFEGKDSFTFDEKPSINVRRVENNDIFSYDVYFDLNLMALRDAVDNSNDGTFIVGNATINDVHCKVEISPIFNGKTNPMTYDIIYSIIGNSNVNVVYDQILYVDGGKVRQKTIQPRTTSIDLDGIELTYTNKGIGDLDKQSIIDDDIIGEILTANKIKRIFIAINNLIPSTNRIQVGYSEQKNPGLEGGIWGFGDELPANAIYSSLGKAIIGGYSYVVKHDGDGLKLSPVTEGEEYTILGLQASSGEYELVGGNYVPEMTTKHAIVGHNPIVQMDELKSTFNVRNIKTYESYTHDSITQTIEHQQKCLTYDNPNLFIQETNITIGGNNYYVIDNKQSEEDTSIGDGLDEYSYFTVGAYEISTDGIYEFNLDIEKEVLSDDGENTWIGVGGKTKIRFSGINLDDADSTPTWEIISTTDCIDLDELPQNINRDRPDSNQMVQMSRYHVIGVEDIQILNNEEVGQGEPVFSIQFKLKAMVQKRLLGAIPTSSDEAYYAYGIYVGHNEVKNAILSYDCAQGVNGDLNYGIIQYSPQMISENTLDAVEFATIYVEYDASGEIASDGYNCPYTLTVLPPEGVRQNDWDIFDRYYSIGISVEASCQAIDSSVDESYFKLNSNNTLTSAHIFPYHGSTYDLDIGSISNSMVKMASDHIRKSMNIDNAYLIQRLSQMKNFLAKVDSELKTDIDRGTVLSLCNFKYGVDIEFENFGTEWNSGIFISELPYSQELGVFNNHLKSEFKSDHNILDFNSESSKDYVHILKDGVDVYEVKHGLLDVIYSDIVAGSDDSTISVIFGSHSDEVKYINLFDTGISGDVLGIYAFDNRCNIFYSNDGIVNWESFSTSEQALQSMLLAGRHYSGNVMHDKLRYNIDSDFQFKFANRDRTSTNNSVDDAYCLRCVDGDVKMIYMSWNGLYACPQSGEQIQDIAYEDNSKMTYVLFNGDSNIYVYGNLSGISDRFGKVVLSKSRSSMVLQTFHSIMMNISSDSMLDSIYIDYYDSEDGYRCEFGIYGHDDEGIHDREKWLSFNGDFRQYNTIIFGDTLFDSNQLNFQNISKNKEMFDILDVNEVDGCYYGLFRDTIRSTDSQDIYTIFKTDGGDGGVIRRLPYEVVCPMMFRISDELYSLWVVTRVPNGYALDDDGKGVVKYKIQLQEVSVPQNSNIYPNRTIDIQDIIGEDDIQINDVMMDGFQVGRNNSKFFVLTNSNFYKIEYENVVKQMSIDTLDNFKQILGVELTNSILKKHMDEDHHGSGHDYFDVIKQKINQFDPDFTVFNLIPTEFGHTQDVGVVPNEKVDDTDESTDHRVDSVVVSTDILQSGGMIVDSDTNPGFITAAVSNPATMYDDDTIFIKSQRNPSIEGTEFYDYIYDENGNELMDLYAIPFIYRINSNNTYDLYINIPTTRTKYLNRIAGTLNSDLTSQVLADDYRDRVNFMNEALPNNLDESTTKLRIYIDRKFISVGNVELVEISGNSIPLQIYRDSVNDGLYDSLALEGRWNGEVEEILEPAKDINKVMLEFEVYGTDSQSIHITGKTLINSFLDDNKYKFG